MDSLKCFTCPKPIDPATIHNRASDIVSEWFFFYIERFYNCQCTTDIEFNDNFASIDNALLRF